MREDKLDLSAKVKAYVLTEEIRFHVIRFDKQCMNDKNNLSLYRREPRMLGCRRQENGYMAHTGHMRIN
ncbi:uncharacterized protein G2W53_022696 [Senna tora]|uniref:Uncharacterized protein n=1 Tax=Senna tora TaxID=362788 RepID=A0A834TN56_9FABA|nr:uncharacterized protein G2W53_022696 [Senna tora]